MTAAVQSVDLDACAREPVHIIGTIQSHGLLIAVSEPDFVIRQVSANVEAVLGAPPDAMLGMPLDAVLGAEQFADFEARLRSDDLSPASALRVTLGSDATPLNCVAHRYDGVLIVEFEFVEKLHGFEASELASNIQIMLSRMERASTVIGYCEVAASEIQRVTGFDRVMVYRFDQEWNGEVIAECCIPMSEPLEPRPLSYLGLHFPATDIPAQARRLFLVNAVRAIADLDEAPVPIVPDIGPITARPLDMSLTFLRSPSPIHVEYLKNMGVRASLAISILVEGRLWGMVAAHHSAPRPIDCLSRSMCEMIARNLSLHVTLRKSNEMWHARGAARKRIDDYRRGLELTGARVDGATLYDAHVLELVDADGMIACIDGVTSTHRLALDASALLPVIEMLRSQATNGIAASDRLSELDPGAAGCAVDASGALYVDLDRDGRDYLVFVRGEFERTVSWAGNPDKSVNADSSGKLHPRRSFEAWQQTVRHHARPWSDVELESAAFIRDQLSHVRALERLRALEALHDADEF